MACHVFAISNQPHPPFFCTTGRGVPSTQCSGFATGCQTRNRAVFIVLEAETLSTANYSVEQPNTNPLTSANNANFPRSKFLLSTQLPRNLSKECRLQEFKRYDPPSFILWLHCGSAKNRAAGHKRGRPLHTYYDTRGKNWFFVIMQEVAVAVHHAQLLYYYGRNYQTGIGVDVHRSTMRALRQTQSL